MAWVLSAIAGVPALATAAWGLVGGYSFRYLPFWLVPYAVPLAVAPQVAFFLMLVRGPRRRASVGAAVAISVLSLAVAGIAVLALGFTLPFSLLDDSGHAPDNFSSLLWAAILSLLYAMAAVFLVIVLISSGRAKPNESEPARYFRALVLVGVIATGVIGSAALAGAVNGARLDAQGIPIGPVGKSWLASRSESSTVYPGAQVVEQALSGEDRELRLSRAAYAQMVFVTGDSATQVSAWYAERLATLGWKLNGQASVSIENSEWDFNRGSRELFQLQSCARAQIRLPAGHAVGPCFWTRYWVFPTGESHL